MSRLSTVRTNIGELGALFVRSLAGARGMPKPWWSARGWSTDGVGGPVIEASEANANIEICSDLIPAGR